MSSSNQSLSEHKITLISETINKHFPSIEIDRFSMESSIWSLTVPRLCTLTLVINKDYNKAEVVVSSIWSSEDSKAVVMMAENLTKILNNVLYNYR